MTGAELQLPVSRRKAALEAAFLTVLFDARKVRGSVGL